MDKEKVKKTKTTETAAENIEEPESGEERKLARSQFIDETYDVFKHYFQNTKEFRDKCRINEDYWRGDNWNHIKPQPKITDPKPHTPILFSMVDNMHSDIMDHYPEPNILPVEVGDEDLCEELNLLVNNVLDRRNFKKLYRKMTRLVLKRGAAVFEIPWDTSLYSGLGDINIQPVDVRYFLWEPGVEDIQDGENVIKFYFRKKRYFNDRYPDQAKDMVPDGWRREIEPYNREDASQDDDKYYLVIDRWYKRWNPATKRNCVHMIRVAGKQILYWSEDNPKTKDNGIYDDGLYPFVIFTCYPLDDTPIGMSVIDVFREYQNYIDKLDQVIVKNALMAGKLRLLKSPNCSIPLEKLADWGEECLEGQGIDESNIRWFQAVSLPSHVQQHYMTKINLMKEESGQNQFNRGEGGKGVTAASAIIALQSAGDKRSRNLIDHLYDSFTDVVRMIIDRMRQYYDDTRTVRVDPVRHEGLYNRLSQAGTGKAVSVSFDPKKWRRVRTNADGKQEEIKRDIELDIKIKPQRQTPTQSVYLNEFAMQMFGAGMIDAVGAVEMMVFEGKDRALKRVKERDKTVELIQSMQKEIDVMRQQLRATFGETPTEVPGPPQQAAV